MLAKVGSPAIHKIMNAAREEARLLLTESEAKAIIFEVGIAATVPRLATSANEATLLAKTIGFPVVLKVDSPDVVHKSDIGSVRLSVANSRQVARAYGEILANVTRRVPKATVRGVTVQRMAPPGLEVIIGTSRDAQFGPVIMFGMGGVFVELFKDVAFRVIPITEWDAEQMMRDLKAFRLLQGYRGHPASSLVALAETLVKVSKLVETYTEIAELDLNPVFAYPDSAVAVDARIMLTEVEEAG
jgi:acetyl-CoA synthetase (ADP-forming)